MSCAGIEPKPCPLCGGDDAAFGAAPEDGHCAERWDRSAKVEPCNGPEGASAGWNARAIDRDGLLKIADELESELSAVYDGCEEAEGHADRFAERTRKAVDA